MNRNRDLLLLAAILLGASAALWWFGPPTLDGEALAARIRQAGPLAPLALVALLVLQCVVAPIPSEPVMMAAGFVYGPVLGLVLSWFGVVLGASACFGLARAFGRPLVLWFVRAERLAALDAWVEDRGVVSTFAVVLGIRLVAFASFDVVSYGCGLIRFPFRWFLAATALGVIPKAFAFSYVGATAAARPGWLDGLILAGTFGFLVAVPWLARRGLSSRVR